MIEKIKCYNIIQRCFNFDYVTNEDIKKQSKLAKNSWPIGASGST